MNLSQQWNQQELDFGPIATSSPDRSSERVIASRLLESPTGEVRLMESICERKNRHKALRRVRKNKGAPGVDGMRVSDLSGYLRRHWPDLHKALMNGTYEPLPVRRKEIPKPDGGVRLLGIPSVVDRVIQQAIAQVLTPVWDPTFSEHSFGFRPGRGQQQAIKCCKEFIEAGYRWTVDIDLAKFFDRVNHDRLLSRLAAKVTDKRVLKLIRKFLTSGVMDGGLTEPTEEGTPQGGPLSPLLSNIVLDELDKELERRGLRFVRYADDCVIYVRSKRAAERVMKSITRFITRTLKLQVNEAKSRITHPWWSKYLGFSFTSKRGDTRIRIHSKSLQRFKEKIRALTKRTRGRSLWQVIAELNDYLRGWWAYYHLSETRSFLRSLNGWILRRLRAYLWKQWRLPRTKYRELTRRGVPHKWACQAANSRKGAWRLSKHPSLRQAYPNRYFTRVMGVVLPG